MQVTQTVICKLTDIRNSYKLTVSTLFLPNKILLYTVQYVQYSMKYELSEIIISFSIFYYLQFFIFFCIFYKNSNGFFVEITVELIHLLYYVVCLLCTVYTVAVAVRVYTHCCRVLFYC